MTRAPKEAGVGHNGGPLLDEDALVKRLVPRVEALEEEMKSLADDRKDLYTEIKAAGLDVKAFRKLIQIRKKSREEHEEQLAVLDRYLGYMDKS